jgi:adenylylsulfate kinase-like enzyme
LKPSRQSDRAGVLFVSTVSPFKQAARQLRHSAGSQERLHVHVADTTVVGLERVIASIRRECLDHVIIFQ